ncbi:MAG: radical SAM protein [Candidatus Poribacteria bacterium]|nr:radical SAM protein [Candidatus Poribacteria bacterium]
MLTYFRTQYGKYPHTCADTYELNEHFIDAIDDEHTLVTTRYRAWVVLDKREYALLVEHRLEEDLDLYSTLEDLGIILTDRNINDVAQMYTVRYKYLSRPPGLFIIIPTKRCNQGCGYCHSSSQYVRPDEVGWDMPEEVAFKTVDFFLSIPRLDPLNFHLEFQGGEALLCYDYVQKIMDYTIEQAKAQGATVSFYIASNLTLMTDEIAEDIKQRRNIRIGSSIDGPKDIHNKQRPMKGGGNAYDKVVYWVNRLRDKFDMNVGVLSTVSRRHLNREKEVIDTQLSLGSNHLTASRFLHYGEKQYRNKMLTAEEALESWKRSLEYILEKNKQGQFCVEYGTLQTLQKLLTLDMDFMCDRRPCGAAVSQITVDQFGDIYACDEGRSIPELAYGNVLTHTYDDIITSETALFSRSFATEVLPMCNTCPVQAYCGACFVRGTSYEGHPVPEPAGSFECELHLKMAPYLIKKMMDKDTAKILNSWV